MRSVIFFLLLALVNCASAAELDCNVKDAKIRFNAEIFRADSMDRKIQVTFEKWPTSIQANTVLQACMNAVVTNNPQFDALGSVWVGNKSVILRNGKRFLAYRADAKKYKYT